MGGTKDRVERSRWGAAGPGERQCLERGEDYLVRDGLFLSEGEDEWY